MTDIKYSSTEMNKGKLNAVLLRLPTRTAVVTQPTPLSDQYRKVVLLYIRTDFHSELKKIPQFSFVFVFFSKSKSYWL